MSAPGDAHGSDPEEPEPMLTHPVLARRDLLKLCGAGAAAALAAPSVALAQAPRRGGTFTVRVWDPPHFDPYLIVAFKTQIVYSFTHSRLLKHKAGPGVQPGSFALEGDLAESWSQPDEMTYVFKLRKGVRWQPKPPVNGRELTAEDIVYSLERFRTVKGNPQNYLLAMMDRAEAPDRYTVKVTLTEPYAWFPDVVANPMTGAIVARECVEKFGDLKKWEATVGSGPWMLESYRPNTGMSLVRHPHYFVPGQPYADRVELVVDEDQASRTAAFLGGKYDLGPEFMGVIGRSDWSQLKGPLERQRPGLKTVDFASNVRIGINMRCDRPPFNDVRVRRLARPQSARPRRGHRRRGRGAQSARPARGTPRVGASHRSARRGCGLLQVRCRAGAPAPRRSRLPARLPDGGGLS